MKCPACGVKNKTIMIDWTNKFVKCTACEHVGEQHKFTEKPKENSIIYTKAKNW